MPAKSKQQQKFMGLVHAYKKGEVPASKVSKAVKDAAKSMSNKSVKKYAKTKHDELPKKVTEKKERDYKAEYKKFQSSTKAKKYRAELNKYNRQKGTYGNGDGKDASHKGGKIVGFEAQSKNRGRKEKSRLKKESAFSVKIDTFQNAMKSLDKLSDILKKGGEKKKSMMVSKLVKQLQQAFFRKEIMEHNISEMKVYSKSQGMKKIKSMKKTGGAKIYKVDRVKTKIGGKNVTMYNLHTRNQNHTSNQNPYGLDMMKGAYLIPIEEGTCGYGLDGNLGEEPAGPHLMKKIKKITKDKEKKLKENKQEKLQIAKTILSQLGGNKFVAMTGAKSFGYDSKGSVVSLQFKIGRNAKQVNIVRINYIKGKDLYEMNFYKGTKLLKKVSNVYADQLRKIFTKHTGMYTSL